MVFNASGTFIVSLDFELFWGVKDSKDLSNYGPNILGARKAIPRLLEIFDKYDIHATFATVGFLFFRDRQQLKFSMPHNLPKYKVKKFSPYFDYIDSIGNSEDADPYHYAPSLIKQILLHPNHEIGSHTFSHYYCHEDGQDISSFRDDLIAFKKTASGFGIKTNTLVFPRNQYRNDYLDVCALEGIIAFRGNENHWICAPRSEKKIGIIIKALRFLDSYFNISGYNCYSVSFIANQLPYNIPSSRFLRPYLPGLRFLESLRLNRITTAMTYAAKNGLIYHLWWHPHNFGINSEENFVFLEKILKHYKFLSEKYGFKSQNMQETAMQIDRQHKDKKKIVLLAQKGFSTNVVFNALENKFGVHTIVLEGKENMKHFLGRRVKKLGMMKVVEQIIFRLLVMRILNFLSRKRVDEILNNSTMCDKSINENKLKKVASVNSQEVIDLLKDTNPDLVVINGTRIISKDVLNCVNCKFLNIHAGIIPKYRGVHGAYWALVNKDKDNCGVSVYLVNGGIDTGEILYQEPIEITCRDNFATYPVLQLAKGIELLDRAINDVFNNRLVIRKGPNESKLWYHPTVSEYVSNFIFKKVK